MRLQSELLKELQKRGWDVTRHAGQLDHLAWYHEVWALESRRSPRSFTLFLTFLTDPQPGTPNPFSLIGTCRRFPENAAEAEGEPTLAMTPRWQQELPQFVAALDALRQARGDPATAPAQHAEELVQYLEGLHASDPSRWTDVLRLAREWRRLGVMIRWKTSSLSSAEGTSPRSRWIPGSSGIRLLFRGTSSSRPQVPLPGNGLLSMWT